MFSATTKESAANVAGDVKTTVYSAKRDARNAAGEISDGLSETAAKAGRAVRGYIDTANEEIHQVSDKVAQEIRTNPVRSSLIALGAGVLLGVLLRR